MTVARRTPRRNRLEKQVEAVLDSLVKDNLNQEEVAKRFKVAPSTISEFVRRHSEELASHQEAFRQAAMTYRISVKEQRIAEAARDYDNICEWEAENGLSETTTRYDRDGNEVGRTIRFRRDVVEAKRAIRREVAEELGQITKGDTTNIAAVVNIIRGGTPLGMSPIPDTIEAEYQLTETPEDS